MLFMALSLWDLLRGRDHAWIPFALTTAGVFFLNLWRSRFLLALDGEQLRYRTLFRGSTLVPLAEIEAVELRIGGSGYRDRFRPPIRLHVTTTQGSQVKPFDINLKVFHRKDIGPFLQVIEASVATQTKSRQKAEAGQGRQDRGKRLGP